jgi:GNAT superfamily N-acetyltransferase
MPQPSEAFCGSWLKKWPPWAATPQPIGIGQALLKAALEWGSQVGCVIAELNALVGNPARFLYEKSGFREFEVQMTLKLRG